MFKILKIFKKKKKKKTNNRYIEDMNYSICNICVYNDDFCFMCSSCEPVYHGYPSNFIATHLPKVDNK